MKLDLLKNPRYHLALVDENEMTKIDQTDQVLRDEMGFATIRTAFMVKGDISRSTVLVEAGYPGTFQADLRIDEPTTASAFRSYFDHLWNYTISNQHHDRRYVRERLTRYLNAIPV